MNQKLTGIVLFCGFLAAVETHAATSLNITWNNSSQQTIALSAIEKFTFSDTDVIFNYTTGLTDDFVATNMRKIAFSGDVAIGETNANESLGFYPNPASDFIYLTEPMTSNTEISVYNIDGRIAMQEKLGDSSSIDVSRLQCGFYLLKLGDKIFKFRKL